MKSPLPFHLFSFILRTLLKVFFSTIFLNYHPFLFFSRTPLLPPTFSFFCLSAPISLFLIFLMGVDFVISDIFNPTSLCRFATFSFILILLCRPLSPPLYLTLTISDYFLPMLSFSLSHTHTFTDDDNNNNTHLMCIFTHEWPYQYVCVNFSIKHH